MIQRLDMTLCDQNLPSIDFKEYRSTDCVSTKEKKAKKSLMELAVEEEHRLTARLRLGSNRKARVLCINPWSNPNIEDSLRLRKINANDGNLNKTKYPLETKEACEKENSIEHLKNMLHRLESPNKRMESNSKRNRFYQNEIDKKPTGSSLASARMNFNEVIRAKDVWSTRQAQLRLLFQPISAFSSKPHTSTNRSRSKSNSHSSGLNLIHLQNRSPMLKKKKVCAAKILNFHARIPESRGSTKKRFSLFELLE